MNFMKPFIKNKISGGPVVDDRGKLIGVISEADCMKEVSDSRYFNMPILDKSVGHFMTKEVETLPASMTLFDAASRFHETSYSGTLFYQPRWFYRGQRAQ